MGEPLWALDACTIADRVRARDVGAGEVLEVFLERIRDLDGDLGSFVFLDAERARAEAAEIDRRIASGDDPGPLAGVPIGVKDLEDVAGMPTTYGSVLYKDNVANADSIQVARLRRAGCVVVGKTAAPEFGTTSFTSTPLHGTTRNPWNLERTPGGSSGGSAAAVSAALLPIATASDGGGSIRIPASYTGLFGPKPTHGRVPRGHFPDSSSTSCFGPISRTVRDAARYFDCVVGPHEQDQFSLPHPGLRYEAALDAPTAGLRAAWSSDLGFGTCAAEVASIAHRGAERLAAAAGLVWVDRAVELRDPGAAWGVLNAPTIYLHAEPGWPDRADELTPVVRYAVDTGMRHIDLRAQARAVRRRWENNRILAEVFEDVDLIVTPTTATTAFAADGPIPMEIDGRRVRPLASISFTYPFNFSGHPAVSVPCGHDRDGMPVGLQVVGRRHSDHVLLAIAGAFERAQPWPKIAPAYA